MHNKSLTMRTNPYGIWLLGGEMLHGIYDDFIYKYFVILRPIQEIEARTNPLIRTDSHCSLAGPDLFGQFLSFSTNGNFNSILNQYYNTPQTTTSKSLALNWGVGNGLAGVYRAFHGPIYLSGVGLNGDVSAWEESCRVGWQRLASWNKRHSLWY